MVAGQERLIAEVALDSGDVRRDGRAKAGGQIVDHDDAFARVEQRQDHVAADIAGSARDQNGHCIVSTLLPPRPPATGRASLDTA